MKTELIEKLKNAKLYYKLHDEDRHLLTLNGNEIDFLLQVLTSVKSESAEDKKQHAIRFGKWLSDNGWQYIADDTWLRGYIEEKLSNELYNEYINTLNNK